MIGALADAGGAPVRGAEVCVATRVAHHRRAARARHRHAHHRLQTAASRSACPPARAARSESPTGAAPTRSPSASSISAQEPSRAWPSSQPAASRTADSVRFDVRIPGPAQAQPPRRHPGARHRQVDPNRGRPNRPRRPLVRPATSSRNTTGTRTLRASEQRSAANRATPTNPGHSKTRHATVTG